MQTKVVYRYRTKQGGINVSPNKPREKTYVGEVTELHRIMADKGMVLTNGEETVCCIDTDTPEAWTEIIEETGEAELISMLKEVL